MGRRSDAPVTTPPLAISTSTGEVIAAKYQDETLALLQAMALALDAQRARSLAGTPDFIDRIWYVHDADDRTAMLANVVLTADNVVVITRTP